MKNDDISTAKLTVVGFQRISEWVVDPTVGCATFPPATAPDNPYKPIGDYKNPQVNDIDG